MLTARLFFSVLLLHAMVALNAQEATETANDICPILIGEELPNTSLRMADGQSVDIKTITKGKPTVLILYRGGWCPYCNKHLSAVQEIESTLIEMGYQILAVSPDKPKGLQQSLQKNKLNYTLLSDSQMALARALGLAFKVDDKTKARYNIMGINLAESSGETHYELPVPALFLIDEKGQVTFSYINPNYKLRLEADVLLSVAKAMQ